MILNKMKEKILIISSGHAKSCLEIISQDEKYQRDLLKKIL